MKDEGGMVKGEGLQSAVGSGQSAADANANGRDLRDAAAEEAREAVAALRRLVNEELARLGMDRKMKVHVSLEFDEFGHTFWRARWVFGKAEEAVAEDTLEECLLKLAARGNREYLRAEADRVRRRIGEFRSLARDLDDLTIEDDRRAREARERLAEEEDARIAREGARE